MLKNWMIICTVMWLIIAVASCTAGNEIEALNRDYQDLSKKFAEKMENADSRDEYRQLAAEREKKLTELLNEIDQSADDEDLMLLTGKILLDLDKLDDARSKFEALCQQASPLAPQAKFGLARVLVKQEKYEEANIIFQQVEDKLQPDDNYFDVIFELAYEVKDLNTREIYSKKFIEYGSNKKRLESYTAMMYENLAVIAKERGNPDEGVRILEAAAEKMQTPEAKADIETALKQIKLLNQPAPGIGTAEWANSTAMDIESLKGKVVLIDFWAPWCPPCRKVIPYLVKYYGKYKDRGLVVIGFTRIYGNYRDDVKDEGKVPREKEIHLINGFLQTNNIAYPVAIADGKETFNTYGVSGIPTLVFIDRDGKVFDIEVGSGSIATLEEKILSLLK